MEKYNNDKQLEALFHAHKQPENDNLFDCLDDLDAEASWGTPLENKDPWDAPLEIPLTFGFSEENNDKFIDNELKLLLTTDPEQGFVRLVETLSRYLYIVAYSTMHNSFIAEEALNESWIKIYKYLAYISRHPYTPLLLPWLCEVVRNTAIDHHRKEIRFDRLKQRKKEELIEETRVSFETPEEAIVRLEREHWIRSMVDRLPQAKADIVKLRYFPDDTESTDPENLKIERFEYIATRLGCNASTVRSRLRRTLLQLREMIKDDSVQAS